MMSLVLIWIMLVALSLRIQPLKKRKRTDRERKKKRKEREIETEIDREGEGERERGGDSKSQREYTISWSFFFTLDPHPIKEVLCSVTQTCYGAVSVPYFSKWHQWKVKASEFIAFLTPSVEQVP